MVRRSLSSLYHLSYCDCVSSSKLLGNCVIFGYSASIAFTFPAEIILKSELSGKFGAEKATPIISATQAATAQIFITVLFLRLFRFLSVIVIIDSSIFPIASPKSSLFINQSPPLTNIRAILFSS